MNEEYVYIKGYEGLYTISRSGNVYSLTKHVNLSPRLGRSGYMEVRLKKDGKVSHKSLHRLLAIAFIPNPENKPCIDHIDGNRMNNKIENLRWCTSKENSNNPVSLRKLSEAVKLSYTKGRKPMPLSAIQKRNVGHYKPVVQYTLDGNYIKQWCSIKEAAESLGISRSQISEACIGKRVKTAKGFLFKWLDRPDDEKSNITVDASEAMQFGNEPLAKIEKIEK